MQRFIAKHSLNKYTMPPEFPFNTITLQRMLVAVEGGERVALTQTLLKLVWEDSVSASDPQAIGRALTAAGHDGERLLAATQEPQIKQALIDNTENAVKRGAFGIPTFYVEGEMYFGKERLGQIEEQLAG